MNKQRKVVITTTYNEMGIIIDTKAEEIPQPNLQPTCNQLATDTISRQAAIDAVNELTKWYLETYHETRPTTVAVIDRLTELPSAQPEPHWIPCSEQLPEDGEIVLVSDGIDYAIAFWRSDADAWDDPLHGWLDSFEFNVKAWRPLPEPYREEGEKDG